MALKVLKPRVALIAPRVATDDPVVPRWGRGRGGRPWRRRRARILERDGYLCQACRRAGRLTLATEVDHIEPQFLGGSDDDDNLEGICGPHHDAKRQREAAAARRGTGGLGRGLT